MGMKLVFLYDKEVKSSIISRKYYKGKVKSSVLLETLEEKLGDLFETNYWHEKSTDTEFHGDVKSGRLEYLIKEGLTEWGK